MSPFMKPSSDYVWKGTINMVDVAQISITAHEVSGNFYFDNKGVKTFISHIINT